MVPVSVAVAMVPTDALVLHLPTLDPARDRLVPSRRAPRALVALQVALASMGAARAEAEEAAEGLAVVTALRASGLLLPRDLQAAARRDLAARTRLFDAEFVLATAVMDAYSQTKHVGRIAIRAAD